MKYSPKLPSIPDLKARAKRRMPGFAFDYVDGAIDQEHGKARNREAWHKVNITPRYLRDVTETDLTASVFGHAYAMPFGVPPIGLGNMMWPGAELALARAAQAANIPYILSTFGTTSLEEIAKAAPDVGWFQLYVPRKMEVMEDMLAKVRAAGYRVLVVTLDIPVGAKRNRELKNGLILPFKFSADLVWQCVCRPRWALQTLAAGQPDFVNLAPYRGREHSNAGLAAFITDFCMKGVTAERIAVIRKLWDGPLVLKGVQYEGDMRAAVDLGVDGIIISNHGGRQLDAAPAPAESLRAVPDDVHSALTVMVDSGIRTGMDVVRAAALGAKMAFSGRAFFWGVGAMGTAGASQVVEIFRDEITRTLKQVGCGAFAEMDGGWLG